LGGHFAVAPRPPKDLFSLLILGTVASHKRDLGCVMVWGRGGERERETKKHVANEGKKPFSPVYKIYIGKEDGVQYHLNDIVSFFIYIYIYIYIYTNNQNDVVSHKTCRFSILKIK
jgi:hypothetical protein